MNPRIKSIKMSACKHINTCSIHFSLDHFSDNFIGRFMNLGITHSNIGDTLYRESIGLSPSVLSAEHKDYIIECVHVAGVRRWRVSTLKKQTKMSIIEMGYYFQHVLLVWLSKM